MIGFNKLIIWVKRNGAACWLSRSYMSYLSPQHLGKTNNSVQRRDNPFLNDWIQLTYSKGKGRRSWKLTVTSLLSYLLGPSAPSTTHDEANSRHDNPRAVTQAVRCCPLTAKARVWSKVRQRGMCGEKCGTEILLRVRRFSSGSTNLPMPHT